MRDFKDEIDRCSDWALLSQILDDISAEIEHIYDDPAEDPTLMESVHDLQLLRRYAENKLERMLD